jgi:hypothetical protein
MFEPVPDLPSPVGAIHNLPDDEAGWLALAAHYRDNGRDDEAAAVRVFWPALRDGLRLRSLESVLDHVRRHADRLGRRAREFEERGLRPDE